MLETVVYEVQNQTNKEIFNFVVGYLILVRNMLTSKSVMSVQGVNLKVQVIFQWSLIYFWKIFQYKNVLKTKKTINSIFNEGILYVAGFCASLAQLSKTLI